MKLFVRIPAAFIFCAFFLNSNRCFSQLSCIDSAVSLNGNSQYVKLAPNDAFADSNFLAKLTGDYTIECLIKWNGGPDFQRIFNFGLGETYFMFLTTSEGATHVPRFAISTTGLTAPQVVDADMVLTQGVYHHIAVTYSKANSLLTIFIDGVNVNSGTINIDADSVYHGSDMHDSSENYIGLSSFAGDPQLNADIDEFRISDTVRYTDNFSPFVPFVPDSYTVALYHFNEGSGQIAADSSGNNYTAVLGSTADADANDPSWVTCSTVLATNLFSFTATNVNEQVQLSWNAASNINTSYYEVEKSTDAVHFTALNKVMQTGTIGNHNYTCTDASPAPGNNYYRLKQVDANGKYVYSQAVYVHINGTFKVYPTIASNTLHISVSQTPASIIIFNATGKAVKKLILNNTDKDVNISALPAGNYFIRNITTNTSLKFVKQ